MSRKLAVLLGLVLFLTSFGIKTTFANVSIESTSVFYTAFHSISYSGSLYSFVVNVTLRGVVDYNYSVDGVLPPTAICHLNAAPNSGNVTVDYHITRPLGSDIDGSRIVPFSFGGQELLRDSLPISIPLDSVATITVVIHGHIFGDINPDVGSVNSTTLEWATYNVYLTVTVSIGSVWEYSMDSPSKQVSGNPNVISTVPEFPLFLIPPLFLTATLLAVTVYRRKTSK